jgi:hypothetical protein
MDMNEIRLFGRDGDGGGEIVACIGLISSGVSFDKWEPLLPYGVRRVESIIGREPVAALAGFYARGGVTDNDFPESALTALAYLRQAVAFFTWLKIIPTLDAQHDESGRSRRLGENEKGLTALQEYKDEENILRLAYEATESLVEALDLGGYGWWTCSATYRQRSGLLLKSKEEFDCYYHIGSHRLFVTLMPIIREVQETEVRPILGSAYLDLLLSGVYPGTVGCLADPARRAVALLTMKKTIERLPVEVIPDGVVQVQQSQPVKSRLRAEQSARSLVAASLGADAKRCLEMVEGLVARLDAGEVAASDKVPGPIVHSRGLTF